MIVVLKFNNTDSGTVFVVQQLRLQLLKHRMLSSIHSRRTKIKSGLEQLSWHSKKKKKKKKKNWCQPNFQAK